MDRGRHRGLALAQHLEKGLVLGVEQRVQLDGEGRQDKLLAGGADATIRSRGTGALVRSKIEAGDTSYERFRVCICMGSEPDQLKVYN